MLNLKNLFNQLSYVFLLLLALKTFKTAFVVLIFKSKNQMEIDNYHPMSVLYNFSKTLENNYKILSSKIFGIE